MDKFGVSVRERDYRSADNSYKFLGVGVLLRECDGYTMNMKKDPFILHEHYEGLYISQIYKKTL